jgi:hypothetical protein
LESRGFRVIRFRNHEVDEDIHAVMDVIVRGVLKANPAECSPPPQPSPPRGGSRKNKKVLTLRGNSLSPGPLAHPGRSLTRRTTAVALGQLRVARARLLPCPLRLFVIQLPSPQSLTRRASELRSGDFGSERAHLLRLPKERGELGVDCRRGAALRASRNLSRRMIVDSADYAHGDNRILVE